MRANLQQKGRPTEADAWNYRLWLLYITAGCRRLGIRLRGGHTFDRAEAAEAQNKKQNDQAGRQNAECQKPFAILRTFQWPVSHDDFSNFVRPTKGLQVAYPNEGRSRRPQLMRSA